MFLPGLQRAWSSNKKKRHNSDFRNGIWIREECQMGTRACSAVNAVALTFLEFYNSLRIFLCRCPIYHWKVMFKNK